MRKKRENECGGYVRFLKEMKGLLSWLDWSIVMRKKKGNREEEAVYKPVATRNESVPNFRKETTGMWDLDETK